MNLTLAHYLLVAKSEWRIPFLVKKPIHDWREYIPQTVMYVFDSESFQNVGYSIDTLFL